MIQALLLITVLTFHSHVVAQETITLQETRRQFQGIRSEEDVKRLMETPIDPKDPESSVLEAYRAASTCMMAEYLFSPIKKLKYFNQGKTSLEDLIAEQKSVEKVYLRLMIQLNIPKLLNYDKNIDEDIAYLQSELPSAKIDVDYKYTMIRNLVTLADKDEVKEVLLGIKLTGIEEKL